MTTPYGPDPTQPDPALVQVREQLAKLAESATQHASTHVDEGSAGPAGQWLAVTRSALQARGMTEPDPTFRELEFEALEEDVDGP